MSTSNTLSVREKVCYGLGDVAFGLAVSSTALWLLKYITDVAGLAPGLAAVALMIGRVWDAVTDPFMGWFTDHTKTRWGKRRPYLLFGAIPFALAYFALWVIPAYESQSSMFWYLTIVLIIFNSFLTIVFVPYTSLTAALTQDYNERTALTGFRMTSSQVAFLIGAAVPSAIVLWVTAESDGSGILTWLGLQSMFGSWAGTERQGFFLMGALFGLIMVGAIWTTFLGTQEREFPTEKKSSSTTPFAYVVRIYEQLKTSVPFRSSVTIVLLSNCAATLIGVSLPYYIQYAVRIKEYQTSVISLLFCVAIVMVPVWVLIAKKMGKAETYRYAMLSYAVLLFFIPFVPAERPDYAYMIALFAGVFHAAAIMLPWAIIPDVVEYDELQSGERREGLFYGGTTFSYKLATAMAIFLSGYILQFSGYQPNVDQTETAVLAIKSMIGPLPAAFLVAASILAFRYPLTAAKHREIVAALEKRRANEPRVE